MLKIWVVTMFGFAACANEHESVLVKRRSVKGTRNTDEDADLLIFRPQILGALH
jgi:hypothetical protein